MANELKRIQGRATIAGTAIGTVPAGATWTIVGIRAANTDTTSEHDFYITINGFSILGTATPLPIGSAFDGITGGNKIVAAAGDAVTAISDSDNDIDIHISYLEQTP